MQINDLLLQLAVLLESKINEIGGDPRDTQQVINFITGCEINKKLVSLIVEQLDDE